METIKHIYKIGYGPSSSHTIAPKRAAIKFIQLIKPYKIKKIEITLYNSLCKTAIGHSTFDILKSEFKNYKTSFIKKIDQKKHPNYFTFNAIKANNDIITRNYISIGGGDVKELINPSKKKYIYKETTFDEIKDYCNKNNLSLKDYIYKNEDSDIKDFLKHIYNTMKKVIKSGLSKEGILPGKLKLERKAKAILNNIKENESEHLKRIRLISAYAYSVSEENGAGGLVVTAPTCGAAGVLPSILYYYEKEYNISEDKIIDALAVSGLIGNIIKKNASITGSTGGCQAEVGSATAMAASAIATLFDYPIDKLEYATEMAIEHQLGLTCDPVMGYVQIPCIERNTFGALRAMSCAKLAIISDKSWQISLDTVIKTMYETGKDLKIEYRETATGGLAKNYKKKNGQNK